MTLPEVQNAIIRCCETGYRLADAECGYSLIGESAVTEDAPGVFVVRFRLQPEKRKALGFLVNHACANVFRCGRNLFVVERVEYGIPYLECVWVIAPPVTQQQ